jgi:hypothetical protein
MNTDNTLTSITLSTETWKIVKNVLKPGDLKARIATLLALEENTLPCSPKEHLRIEAILAV